MNKWRNSQFKFKNGKVWSQRNFNSNSKKPWVAIHDSWRDCVLRSPEFWHRRKYNHDYKFLTTQYCHFLQRRKEVSWPSKVTFAETQRNPLDPRPPNDKRPSWPIQGLPSFRQTNHWCLIFNLSEMLKAKIIDQISTYVRNQTNKVQPILDNLNKASATDQLVESYIADIVLYMFQLMGSVRAEEF